MFGPNLHIEHKGVALTLRAFTKDEMRELAPKFSSLRVRMYTRGLFSVTAEDEEEWFEKTRKDEYGCVWGIVPAGKETPIGVTGLHRLDPYNGSCMSGVILFEPAWWGKGVAGTAHLARTLFASDYLNRITIQSYVLVVNEASARALQKVGYILTGKQLRNGYRQGQYLDTLVFSWLHPEKIGLLYPDGLPAEYESGVEVARTALATAREVVKVV